MRFPACLTPPTSTPRHSATQWWGGPAGCTVVGGTAMRAGEGEMRREGACISSSSSWGEGKEGAVFNSNHLALKVSAHCEYYAVK